MLFYVHFVLVLLQFLQLKYVSFYRLTTAAVSLKFEWTKNNSCMHIWIGNGTENRTNYSLIQLAAWPRRLKQWCGNYFRTGGERPNAPKPGTQNRVFRWNWIVFCPKYKRSLKKRSSPDLECLFDPKTSVF